MSPLVANVVSVSVRPLSLSAPFDFDLTLGSYASFSPPLPEAVDLYAPGLFQRVLRVPGGGLHLLVARPAGSVERPEIAVTIWPQPAGPDARALLRQIEWMMSGELDLAAFYKIARLRDPVMAGVTSQLHGLRPPRTPEPFEAVVIAITEQLTSIKTAGTLRARLVARFGERLMLDGQTFYAFPTPASLASADPAEIRRVGFLTTKAVSIVEVARRVVDGTLDLGGLATQPYEEVFRALRSVKGIGPWTIAYALSRGYGRYEAVPDGDVALRAAVSQRYRQGARVTDADVRMALEPLEEWKGLAAFYLIVAYAVDRYGLFGRSKVL